MGRTRLYIIYSWFHVCLLITFSPGRLRVAGYEVHSKPTASKMQSFLTSLLGSGFFWGNRHVLRARHRCPKVPGFDPEIVRDLDSRLRLLKLNWPITVGKMVFLKRKRKKRVVLPLEERLLQNFPGKKNEAIPPAFREARKFVQIFPNNEICVGGRKLHTTFPSFNQPSLRILFRWTIQRFMSSVDSRGHLVSPLPSLGHLMRIFMKHEPKYLSFM